MLKNIEDLVTKKEFQELSEKMDNHLIHLEKRIDLCATKKEFQELSKTMDQRFQRVDEQFLKIDQRFQKVEGRLDRLENKIELCATKKDLEEKFEEAKSYMGVLLEDLKHKLDLVIEVFSPHQEIISDHEKRISNLETDNLVFKTLNLRKS